MLMLRVTLLLSSLLLALPTYSSVETGWFIARDQHFEVLSQPGRSDAISGLNAFEQLRSFFASNHILAGSGSPSSDRGPVRIIGFRSAREYDAFRLRAAADAYYVGAPEADYIVMPQLGSAAFNIAAHEYAHLVMHQRGISLPPWLAEGLAEVFSTIKLEGQRFAVGGAPAGRLNVLQREMPIASVILFSPDANRTMDRNQASAFYAASWVLVDMLAFDPAYAGRFQSLIDAISSGNADTLSVFEHLYGKSPDSLRSEALRRAAGGNLPRQLLPMPQPEPAGPEVQPCSDWEAQTRIADVLLSMGEFQRAEVLLRPVWAAHPGDPRALAALATTQAHKGDLTGAAQSWTKATDGGYSDAAGSFRFATIAEEKSAPLELIKGALENAVNSSYPFDDARYKLALVANTLGDFEEAVAQLRLMRAPSRGRAYSYWTALAFALTRLDRRDEAAIVANQAIASAGSSEELSRARELLYTAKTDLAVQFETDAEGHSHLVTTRVPHGTTTFNPFIQPSDHLQRSEGQLKEVRCGEGKLTGFVVSVEGHNLLLSVQDPTRVLMQNSPAEFSCGTQQPKPVRVEFALESSPGISLLRGMQFLPIDSR